MRRLTFDFETRSRVELTSKGQRVGSGAYKYSLDPSTIPTCLAAKFRGQDAMMFLTFEEINQPWSKVPSGFRYHWTHAIQTGYEFAAHNAFFETCIYKNILVSRYGWPDIPFDRFVCTAAKAAACALPRNLAGAGEALKLTTQKDPRGYVAMMATCKPTKQWNAWRAARAAVASGARVGDKKKQLANSPEPPVFLEPKAAPHVWQTLYEYCLIDVRTEELLDETIPDLIPAEREIWLLNQKLNWRGLRVDIPTVQKISDIMAVESKSGLKELDSLTMGLVTKAGARKSILEFLALEGVELPDIKAKTVEDMLKGGALSPDMRRLLEIRKALSKTSTKKYEAFLARANDDQRVRDIILYHGASTGRDTGTGIQPHNFPRGAIPVDRNRPYAHVENVIECDHETLKVLYGGGLPIVFSSILRNMIIPSDGSELFVADFSKIEVAVLWWAAENEPGLAVLRSGKDPYIYMASANTGRPYEDFDESSPERQLGKAQVLGCGFGLGAAKFQTTAWDMYRLKMTENEAKLAVARYRVQNAAVPAVWKAYEKAAVDAIESPGSIHLAGKCAFSVRKQFLWIKLPSGRKLAYRDPQISWRETDWGPRKTVEFWAVNSKTKKWAVERTWGGTITENIIQAIARDLMMSGIVKLEHHGYRALLTVHDEAICERELGEGDLTEFSKILCEIPSWGAGLPIEAKGYQAMRYRK